MIVNTKENRYLTDSETEALITTVARGYKVGNGKILPDLPNALVFYLNVLTGVDFYSNDNLKTSKIKQDNGHYYIDDYNYHLNMTERFYISKLAIDVIIECENYLNNYIDNLVEVDEIVKRHEKFRKVCKHLDIKNANYNALRRTYASNVFNEYENYDDVREALNLYDITDAVEFLGAYRRYPLKTENKNVKSEKTHFLNIDLFS